MSPRSVDRASLPAKHTGIKMILITSLSKKAKKKKTFDMIALHVLQIYAGRFQAIPGNFMINIRKLHSKLPTVPLPCHSLSEGPLVRLSMLWLQDLCIQRVITVPTLSSESLWRRLSDCSPRHTDPSVCHTDFPFICTSSFSFPCPSRHPSSLVILFFHVLFSPPQQHSRLMIFAHPLALLPPACAFVRVPPTTLGHSCCNLLQMPSCYRRTTEPRFGHPAVLTQKNNKS